VGEGALGTAQATDHLNALYDLCTVVIDREPPAMLFDFSRSHGVSAYDAAYLMMALSQGSQIATLDKKMRQVARKLDIEITVIATYQLHPIFNIIVLFSGIDNVITSSIKK
jgi:predicted nucleic acid-binding protein